MISIFLENKKKMSVVPEDSKCYIVYTNKGDSGPTEIRVPDKQKFLSIPCLDKISSERIRLVQSAESEFCATFLNDKKNFKLFIRSPVAIDSENVNLAIDVCSGMRHFDPEIDNYTLEEAVQLCIQLISFYTHQEVDTSSNSDEPRINISIMLETKLWEFLSEIVLYAFQSNSTRNKKFPRFPPEISYLRNKLVNELSNKIVMVYEKLQSEQLAIEKAFRQIQQLARNFDNSSDTTTQRTVQMVRTITEFDKQLFENFSKQTDFCFEGNPKEQLVMPRIPPRLWTIDNYQLKKLELVNLDLEFVPMIMTKFELLEHLNLSGNCMKTVPEAIQNLKRLSVLNLSSNEIRAIEQPFSENLSILLLRNNNLSEIAAEYTKALKNLKKLDIAGNHIKELDDKAFSKKQALLEKIDISDNQFLILPKCLRNLPRLLKLRADNNALTSSNDDAATIQSLENLNSISMNNNSHVQIVKEILLHPNLVNISLESNKIESLEHVSASDFNAIDSRIDLVNLSNNSLVNIDMTKIFGRALSATLSILDISNNQFSQLPDFSKFQNLIRLDVSNNNLHAIQAKNLPPTLSVLILSDNKITNIPVQMMKVLKNSLRELILSNNLIGIVEDEFVDVVREIDDDCCSNSKRSDLRIDLSKNQFHELPDFALRSKKVIIIHDEIAKGNDGLLEEIVFDLNLNSSSEHDDQSQTETNFETGSINLASSIMMPISEDWKDVETDT